MQTPSRALLFIALAAGVLLAWTGSKAPAPLPADAPAASFSAMRAKADVDAIAARPHPTGSLENAQVRDHLLARLRAIGLTDITVQRRQALEEAEGVKPFVLGAVIENISAVLPGKSKGGPAVVVMSHYDSVAGAPGAGDAAAGVASALEIARALKAQGPTERDVMLLFTDGEEQGMLGARAWFADAANRSRVGAVLNLDARGSRGRTMMFRTSRDAGGLVSAYVASASHPTTMSLWGLLYRYLPNDTDLTIIDGYGIPALDLAFADGQFDYHSPTDTPANLDLGSLQSMGAQVLPTVRALADASALPSTSAGGTYGDVFGLFVLAYPDWMGWLILMFSGCVIATALVRARERWNWRGIGQGVSAGLWIIFAAALLAHLARLLTGIGPSLSEQRQLQAQILTFEIALLLLLGGAALASLSIIGRAGVRWWAVGMSLVLGFACSLFAGLDLVGLILGILASLAACFVFRSPVSVWSLWAGALAVAGLLSALLLALAPAASPIILWPLALAALAMLAALASPRAAGVLLTLVAALALGYAGAFGHLLVVGFGSAFAEPVALTIFIAALALPPLIIGVRGVAFLGACALVAGLALLLVIRYTTEPSARHPTASQIVYVVEPGGRFTRVSLMRSLDNWSRAVLQADGGRIERRSIELLGGRPFDQARARAVTIAHPRLSLRRQVGAWELHLEPAADGRELWLMLRSDVALAAPSVNGIPTPSLTAVNVWSTVRWRSDGQPLTVAFRAARPGVVEAHYAEILDQWPADARPLPARPPSVSAWGMSNKTIVTGSARFALKP